MKRHIAIVCFIVLLMPSCITYEKCVDKYGMTGDTTYIPYKVTIPKDSIITSIQIDSIPFLVPGDTQYIENPLSRAKIKYWRDLYLKAINIQAECDSIVIHDTIPCPPVLTLKNNVSEVKTLWHLWEQISSYTLPMLLLIGIIFFIIYLKFKK